MATDPPGADYSIITGTVPDIKAARAERLFVPTLTETAKLTQFSSRLPYSPNHPMHLFASVTSAFRG